jgi:hypothetical protein
MHHPALIENTEEEVRVDAFADLAQRIEDKDARRRQRLLDASRMDDRNDS